MKEEQNSLLRTDRDMLCPVCDLQVKTASLVEAAADESPVVLREWIGHCAACGNDYDVIQFRHAGRWVSHKFRIARKGASFGAWFGLEPLLPEAAEAPVIMTGPGGDYTCSISDEELAGYIESLQRAANWIGEQLTRMRLFIDYKKGLKQQHGQQNG